MSLLFLFSDVFVDAWAPSNARRQMNTHGTSRFPRDTCAATFNSIPPGICIEPTRCLVHENCMHQAGSNMVGRQTTCQNSSQKSVNLLNDRYSHTFPHGRVSKLAASLQPSFYQSNVLYSYPVYRYISTSQFPTSGCVSYGQIIMIYGAVSTSSSARRTEEGP